MKKLAPQPASSERSSTLFVASVEKAFMVLAAFRRAQKEAGLLDMGLSDIAEFSGLDKSAAQRFANTLQHLGYLDKDARTRRYRPGIKLLDLTYTYLVSDRLAETAMHRLIEASRAYATTVNLCRLADTDVIYVVRVPHEKTAYRSSIPGRRVPVYCTSAGIAMLAFRPEAEAAEILQKCKIKPVTEWTITDPAHIAKRIEAARHDGFALGYQQIVPAEISIAAPIISEQGRAIGAVQIPVYTPHWTIEKARDKLGPLAMETARAISGSYVSKE